MGILKKKRYWLITTAIFVILVVAAHFLSYRDDRPGDGALTFGFPLPYYSEGVSMIMSQHGNVDKQWIPWGLAFDLIAAFLCSMFLSVGPEILMVRKTGVEVGVNPDSNGSSCE